MVAFAGIFRTFSRIAKDTVLKSRCRLIGKQCNYSRVEVGVGVKVCLCAYVLFHTALYWNKKIGLNVFRMSAVTSFWPKLAVWKKHRHECLLICTSKRLTLPIHWLPLLVLVVCAVADFPVMQEVTQSIQVKMSVCISFGWSSALSNSAV